MKRQLKPSKQVQHHLGWLYVVLGIIIMMLLGTVYSYSVFRLSLQRAYNIGLAESGTPYMTALAFYSIFMFLTGKYIEKFKPRTILMTGELLVALGWILSSMATNIALLTLTYGCISGAGVGIAYGVPLSVVAKWFPQRKGFVLGLVLIGFGLSPLITAPIARSLVENYGVMTAFLILGVSFGVLLPLLSTPFKYPQDDVLNKKNSHSIKETLTGDLDTKNMIKSKSFKGIYLNFVIGTMIGLMMIGMTTNVGVELIGLDSTKVTKFMAIFAIFNGLGRPLFGWLTDRYASKKAMLLSYALISLAAITLIAFGSNNTMIYIIAFSIFWFNLGGWLAIVPTATLRSYGLKYYSQNYGLVFTAYGVGAISGVSTSGFLLDFNGNYHYVFYYILVLCFIGSIITCKYIND